MSDYKNQRDSLRKRSQLAAKLIANANEIIWSQCSSCNDCESCIYRRTCDAKCRALDLQQKITNERRELHAARFANQVHI